MPEGKEAKTLPPQEQERQPGLESEMTPQPLAERDNHVGSGKLRNKIAVITGGDSGIGRAAAVLFAKEGADVAVLYLDEHEDAEETRRMIQEEGRHCLLIPGDVGHEEFCRAAVEKIVKEFGRIDILVNNAAEQHPQEKLEDITAEQLEKTFRTNIFSMFFLTKAALKYMKEGSAIINTSSVTAYRGSSSLLDYASTKGAIVAFTRSLAQSLAERQIRVNGVAPGPIWTPLIPSTFPSEKTESFGANTLAGRPGQPAEVAPCYLFLASADSSYMTGQFLHPNGGDYISS